MRQHITGDSEFQIRRLCSIAVMVEDQPENMREKVLNIT